MKGSNFMVSFIFRYAWIWLVLLSALGVTGLVLGLTVDLSWAIVGLMIILILLPLIALFVYYFYALRPECYVNTVRHSISFSEQGIRATLCFNDETVRRQFFPFSDFDKIDLNVKSVLIRFRKPRKGYIWIPLYAYGSEEEFADMVSFVIDRIK